MKTLTPEEFLDEVLMSMGAARYTPSRCAHGVRMEDMCHKCLRECDEVLHQD